jgi:hypothetical protein
MQDFNDSMNSSIQKYFDAFDVIMLNETDCFTHDSEENSN